MNRIVSKSMRSLRRLKLAIRAATKVYQTGGYTEVAVTQIQHGHSLDGKNILITGGGSGIGLAIAKACGAEGANVIISGRSSQRLESARGQITAPLVKTVVWDVSDLKILGEKLEEVHQLAGGSIDAVVNNAAILIRGDFPNISESHWDDVYRTNSKAVFFLSQAICSRWLSTPTAGIRKILNISSQGGFVGATYPYRMTKWDVAGLTQGLGLKLARHGILVNGIAPGVVATDMMPEALQQGGNLYYPDNAAERYCLPIEIAELAKFMLSDASNFLVGQTILCDGGFSSK